MGILLAIHVIITVFLILIVLVQKNEGGSSLFASSGGSGGMFNARGTSNILTKITWVLASLFLANCVLMASLASSKIKNEQTLIESRKQDTNEDTPPTPLSKDMDNEAAGLSDEDDATPESEEDLAESKMTSEKDEEAETTKEEVSAYKNDEAETTPDNSNDESEVASKSEEDSNKED